MKKNTKSQQRPQALKQKLMSALVMLMIATILMSSTTYAWFVLSTAPEVTGIETQVGANGSLEIALLNTDTRADLSTIRAGLGGGSLQENKMAANNVWGNLVDLSFAEYGLGKLILMPARLNTSDGTSVVSRSLLAVPSYGYDGRIIELDKSTGSAILQEGQFLYSPATQTYGVRAIGSSDGTTVQGSYLGAAQETVKNSAKKAQADTRAVLNNNGADLFGVLMKYALNKDASTYNDSDKAILLSMLNGLEGVLTNIDGAFRQSLVAYAASQIADEATFETARVQIMNKEAKLSSLLSTVSGLPSAFTGWVNDLEDMQNDLNEAVNACNALTGGTYTWDQIKPILSSIMNMDGLYINDKMFKDINPTELMGAGSVEVTMAPGSGLFADIADFSGNYSTVLTAMGMEVTMETASAVSPAHLVRLYEGISGLTPAVGDTGAPATPLKATYGYAIDLAFRCNAADPDLLLQTKGVQRIYSSDEDTENSGTQGAGSYMEFTSMDAEFTAEQRLALMDAIRVGFVDDQGQILAIAKLNVADRSMENGGVVRAPLYLYDYSFVQDDVSDGQILTMGERRLTDNLITDLDQNVAKAVTAIVWLDGDIVDNTMVSAKAATSLNGVLNLQFATSAELIPAGEGEVMNYTSDREGLNLAVADAKTTVDAKQGTYTNVSWNNFMDAYNRAQNVKANTASGTIEIGKAIKALEEAKGALEVVSTEALTKKIAEIREIMGQKDEVVRYAILDEDGNYILAGGNAFTQAEKNAWDIKAEIKNVDYMGKNVVNEKDADENDTTIRTTKYTDESWNALAEALYLAEAKVANPQINDDEINKQLTALEIAQNNLEFAAFFTPYEYKGDVYYMANYAKDATDTYGRWYDTEFNRIFSDVTILKLDAYAGLVDIAVLSQEGYVDSTEDYLITDIEFLKGVYPELQNAKPKGVHWFDIDSTYFEELMGPAHKNKMEELLFTLANDDILQYNPDKAATAKADVEDLISRFNSGEDIPVADARSAANTLKTTLAEMYKENKKAKEKEEAGDAYVETVEMPAVLTFADVEFDVPFSGTRLKLTGKTGETTLSAKVLTEDGVVLDVSTELIIYVKAEKATVTPATATVETGKTADLTAELVFDIVGAPKEKIKSIRWASSDTKIATVASGATAEAGVITGVAKGTATITGTVTTDAGNDYSIEMTVTVTE